MENCLIKSEEVNKVVLYSIDRKIHYPIGLYIMENLPNIFAMANMINTLPIGKDKNIILACRGSSGAIITSIISTKLNKNCKIYHVKKKGEYSHSNNLPYINKDDFVIIVDDFVASGDTIETIIKTVLEISPYDKVDCLCIDHFQRNDAKENILPLFNYVITNKNFLR